MFQISVVSLLSEIVEPVGRFGVVGRACERGLLKVEHISPRDFVSDPHRTVDDRPYGGGPGMILKYEPLRDAIRHARQGLPAKSREFVLSAQGRPFDPGLARELARSQGLLLIAGRAEVLAEGILGNGVHAHPSTGD